MIRRLAPLLLLVAAAGCHRKPADQPTLDDRAEAQAKTAAKTEADLAAAETAARAPLPPTAAPPRARADRPPRTHSDTERDAVDADTESRPAETLPTP